MNRLHHMGYQPTFFCLRPIICILNLKINLCILFYILFAAPPECDVGQINCGQYVFNKTYCIAPHYRCDMTVDCMDGSDESDCSKWPSHLSTSTYIKLRPKILIALIIVYYLSLMQHIENVSRPTFIAVLHHRLPCRRWPAPVVAWPILVYR